MDDKRARGLCLWCDGKFSPGHRCAKKQIYVIEMEDEPEIEEEGVKIEEEELPEVELVDSPRISIHSLSSTQSFKTM